MFQTLKKRIKNEKGLTLIELLAVIVILAIIAAIAIPAIGNIIENSRYNAAKADAINVLNAAQLYYTDNPGGEAETGSSAGADTTTNITVSELKTAKVLDSAGKIPDTATISATNPHKLTITGVVYSGNKKVSFNDVSIEDITKDNTKGSSDNDKNIGTATTEEEPKQQ